MSYIHCITRRNPWEYLNVGNKSLTQRNRKSSLTDVFKAVITEIEQTDLKTLTKEQWMGLRNKINESYNKRNRNLCFLQKIFEGCFFHQLFSIHARYQQLNRLINNAIDRSSTFKPTTIISQPTIKHMPTVTVKDMPVVKDTPKHVPIVTVVPSIKDVPVVVRDEPKYTPTVKHVHVVKDEPKHTPTVKVEPVFKEIPKKIHSTTTHEKPKTPLKIQPTIGNQAYASEWAELEKLAELLYQTPDNNDLKKRLEVDFTEFSQKFGVDSHRLHLPYFGIKFASDNAFYVVTKFTTEHWKDKSHSIYKTFKTEEKYKTINFELNSSKSWRVVEDLSAWFDHGKLPTHDRFLSEYLDLLKTNRTLDIPENSEHVWFDQSKLPPTHHRFLSEFLDLLEIALTLDIPENSALKQWVIDNLSRIWGLTGSFEEDDFCLKEKPQAAHMIDKILKKNFMISWVKHFGFSDCNKPNRISFDKIVKCLSSFEQLEKVSLPKTISRSKEAMTGDLILDFIQNEMIANEKAFPLLNIIQIGSWDPSKTMALKEPVKDGDKTSWEWNITETRTITLIAS